MKIKKKNINLFIKILFTFYNLVLTSYIFINSFIFGIDVFDSIINFIPNLLLEYDFSYGYHGYITLLFGSFSFCVFSLPIYLMFLLNFHSGKIEKITDFIADKISGQKHAGYYCYRYSRRYRYYEVPKKDFKDANPLLQGFVVLVFSLCASLIISLAVMILGNRIFQYFLNMNILTYATFAFLSYVTKKMINEISKEVSPYFDMNEKEVEPEVLADSEFVEINIDLLEIKDQTFDFLKYHFNII
jgi:hypothetical protein